MCLCEPPMWDEGWPEKSKCGWTGEKGEATYMYTVVDTTPRGM